MVLAVARAACAVVAAGGRRGAARRVRGVAASFEAAAFFGVEVRFRFDDERDGLVDAFERSSGKKSYTRRIRHGWRLGSGGERAWERVN